MTAFTHPAISIPSPNTQPPKTPDQPPAWLDFCEITYISPMSTPLHPIFLTAAGGYHIFALIIGINEYDDNTELKGAVPDACNMKQYLTEYHHVPEDHILMLLDRDATRGGVIKAMKDIRADKRIRHGDAILIFYSGHGGERPTPPGWGPERMAQCLLPQDFKATNVIPDRTISALLEGIAKAKGDNITVILDCCHAGSGTRKEYRTRRVKLDVDIPEDLDRNIWGSRDGSVHDDSIYHGLQSHVLLAACGEKEVACEDDDGGHFTKALLGILRNCPDGNLTYAGICERAKLKEQTPHCEGSNQHRVLFDTKVPIRRQVLYGVQADAGKCVIDAGRAHGVSNGVEFTLYDKQQTGGLVARTVVPVDLKAKINNFQTTVSIPVNLGNIALAKLTRVGKVPLYLVPRDCTPLRDILRKMASPNFQVVNRGEEAELEMWLENDLANFSVLDPQANRLGLTKLPYEASLNRLAHVLDGAAHFFWFLRHGNTNNRRSRAVEVNFYRLEIDYDEWGLPYHVTDGPGQCRCEGDRDVIDFVVDPESFYGVEIKNLTPRDLFLNAFLFNVSTLSIAPYYTQFTTGNPEAPLKAGGTFTMGYGPGGTPPFRYSLEKGQDIDVGYLKIFFSTRPIDLCDAEQKSPFDSVRQPTKQNTRTGGGAEYAVARNVETKDICFTASIPIVQRRQ